MPKDKRTKKFALRLRMVNRKTVEAEKKDRKAKEQEKLKREREKAARDDPDSNLLEVEQATKPSTALFFSYNMSLGPPYQIILDTNFINLAIQNKIDIFDGLMDCLYAKCIPIITDCVMGLWTALFFVFFLAFCFLTLFLTNSGAGEAGDQVPRGAADCARPAVQAADVHAPGHVRGRLHCGARDGRQVLHCGDVRPRPQAPHPQDPRCPHHVHCRPPLHSRAHA